MTEPLVNFSAAALASAGVEAGINLGVGTPYLLSTSMDRYSCKLKFRTCWDAGAAARAQNGVLIAERAEARRGTEATARMTGGRGWWARATTRRSTTLGPVSSNSRFVGNDSGARDNEEEQHRCIIPATSPVYSSPHDASWQLHSAQTTVKTCLLPASDLALIRPKKSYSAALRECFSA